MKPGISFRGNSLITVRVLTLFLTVLEFWIKQIVLAIKPKKKKRQAFTLRLTLSSNNFLIISCQILNKEFYSSFRKILLEIILQP